MMVQYSGTARNGLALYGGGNGHTVVRFYFATYIGFVVCSVPLYREEYRSDVYIGFMMGTAADTAAVQQFVVYWSGFISEQEDVMAKKKAIINRDYSDSTRALRTKLRIYNTDSHADIDKRIEKLKNIMHLCRSLRMSVDFESACFIAKYGWH